MNDFFKTLISLSLSGSILMILIGMVKVIFKGKVSRKYQYYIWLLVIFRLLIPLSPKINLVNRGFQDAGHILQADVGVQTVAQTNGTDTIKDQQKDSLLEQKFINQAGILNAGNTSNEMQWKRVLIEGMFYLWIVVAGILFINRIRIYCHFQKYIRQESHAVSDLRYLEMLGVLVDELKITRRIGLYENPNITSPLLIGFFRGNIVLPSLEISDADMKNTMLHELIHYKRRDMFYKWLVQLTLCIHWFNPAMYWMERKMNHDCELSCDEAVLKILEKFGIEEQFAYGDTLMNAARAGVKSRNTLAAVTLFESGNILKERLCAIMNHKKITKTGIFIAVCLTVILAIGAYCLGSYRMDKAVPASIEKTDKANVVNTRILQNEDTAVHMEIKSENNDYYWNSDEFFLTKSYYYDSYVFLLGWGNTGNNKSQYPVNTVMENENLPAMNVYFHEQCKQCLDEQEAMEALEGLLVQTKAKSETKEFASSDMSVLQYQYVGTDLSKAAQESYSKNEGWIFRALIPQLSKEEQSDYAKQIYQDDRIDYFSEIMNYLSSEECRDYEKKAYEDEKINFFCVLIESVSAEELQNYAKKSYEDDKISFFSTLLEYVSKEERLDYAKRAYEDNRINFFSTLIEELDEDVLHAYMEKSYVEDKINFFSVIINNIDLSDKQVTEYATRAKDDGKVSFSSVLEME